MRHLKNVTVAKANILGDVGGWIADNPIVGAVAALILGFSGIFNKG